MMKLSDNPPVTLPGVESVLALSGTWYVAHTKARNEKAVAWDLLRAEISYFLPLVEKVTFSGGRKRRNMAALFPGYVFFNGDVDARYTAFGTNRLANIIAVPDQELLRRELRQLELAVASAEPIDAYPELQVGRQVRVKSGPLKGVIGLVANREDVTLLVLSVTMLGQSAHLRVEPGLLEPWD